MNRMHWIFLAAWIPAATWGTSGVKRGPKGRTSDRTTETLRDDATGAEQIVDTGLPVDPALDIAAAVDPDAIAPSAPRRILESIPETHSCCHARAATAAAVAGLVPVSPENTAPSAKDQAAAVLRDAIEGANAGTSKSPAFDGNDDRNAAAAAEFELKFRGERNPNRWGDFYPSARPVPFEETKHILPLSHDKNPIYRIQEIVADFRKNRTEDQQGILVVLKTEYCHKNMFRPCAVTTSALDNFSPPELARFRMYGAWVKYETGARPDLFDNETGRRYMEARSMRVPRSELERRFPKQAAWQKWSDDVEHYYNFNQGPGSNIFFINPNVDLEELARNPIRDMYDAVRRGVVIRTDAVDAGYLYGYSGEKPDLVGPMRRQIQRVNDAFHLEVPKAPEPAKDKKKSPTKKKPARKPRRS